MHFIGKKYLFFSEVTFRPKLNKMITIFRRFFNGVIGSVDFLSSKYFPIRQKEFGHEI